MKNTTTKIGFAIVWLNVVTSASVAPGCRNYFPCPLVATLAVLTDIPEEERCISISPDVIVPPDDPGKI